MRYIITLTMIIALSACGKVGPAGPPGPAGATGAQGLAAQTCTINSTSTGATITCPDGTSSSISNGTNGTNGLAGLDGTQISEVQFCPSTFVPVYPSVFPEIGLCINHALIGVYSANGGFLSPLPQGSYSSNGINASCNFIIGADCAVTD